jgi:hypothetical protein
LASKLRQSTSGQSSNFFAHLKDALNNGGLSGALLPRTENEGDGIDWPSELKSLELEAPKYTQNKTELDNHLLLYGILRKALPVRAIDKILDFLDRFHDVNSAIDDSIEEGMSSNEQKQVLYNHEAIVHDLERNSNLRHDISSLQNLWNKIPQQFRIEIKSWIGRSFQTYVRQSEWFAVKIEPHLAQKFKSNEDLLKADPAEVATVLLSFYGLIHE